MREKLQLLYNQSLALRKSANLLHQDCVGVWINTDKKSRLWNKQKCVWNIVFRVFGIPSFTHPASLSLCSASKTVTGPNMKFRHRVVHELWVKANSFWRNTLHRGPLQMSHGFLQPLKGHGYSLMRRLWCPLSSVHLPPTVFLILSSLKIYETYCCSRFLRFHTGQTATSDSQRMTLWLFVREPHPRGPAAWLKLIWK